jgi:phage tail-like protein
VRVEVPGLFLDAIGLGSPTSELQVQNRDPEPDEQQVPVDGVISLQIVPDAGEQVDIGTIRVAISLYADAVYAPGTGFSDDVAGSSSVTVLDTGAVEIVMILLAPMPSLFTVVVDVDAAVVGGTVVHTSYSFVTEDLIPPATVVAETRGRGSVLATFDEDIDPSIATDPAIYSFRIVTAPTYVPVVVSAVMSGTGAVLLELDDDLTLGASYELVVTGVADIWGNVSGELVAAFEMLMPTEFANREHDLYRMLPSVNRKADILGDARKLIGVFQDVLDHLLYDIDQWSQIFDPARAPDGFLDAMLRSLGNPFVFEGMTTNDKRRLVVVLTTLYKQKGTVAGITNSIRFFLGIEAEVFAFNTDCWILGEDTLGETTLCGSGSDLALYSFNVVVQVFLTDIERVRILELVRIMRPAHTKLNQLVEPVIPEVIDHWQIGFSILGEQTILH